MSKSDLDVLERMHENNMKFHEDWGYGYYDGEDAFSKGKKMDEIDLSYRSDGYVDGFKQGYEKAKMEAASATCFDEAKHRGI